MKTQFISTKQVVLKTIGLFGLLMIFCLFANPIYAQSKERTVTGVVNTLDGPLFAANIVLKGTATSVISNENGEFTFPKALKENDVLLISYLGYESQEITIDNDTFFIRPFLEDIAIVVVASMRTEGVAISSAKKKN